MLAAVAVWPCLFAGTSQAVAIDTGTDLDVNWTNSITLSTVYRFGRITSKGSFYCGQGQAGGELDDCMYGQGFDTGRIDLLSELDLAKNGYGLHVSATGWWDAVDTRGGNNPVAAPGDYHPQSGTPIHYDFSEYGGHHLELFDAFVHGTANLGDDSPFAFRIGRHALIWGESLFFRSNGIAAGQAPVDTYRVRSTGPYQMRDSVLPVAQASFTWHLADDLALAAYQQLEWRRSRIDPEDAYSGTADILGAQGNRLIALELPAVGPVYYRRVSDRRPDGFDQFGVSLRWQRGDFDYGLYAVRFDAKTPVTLLTPGGWPAPGLGGPIGTYRLEFPTGIETYGISAAGPIGDASFGAELSARRRMPLVIGGVFAPSGVTQGSGPIYPLGDTLHAQFSWTYAVPPGSILEDGATWTGEIAANRLIGVTANEERLIAGRTSTAAALRMVFEPQFLQILPRFDLAIPIGIGWNFLGLSETDPAMNRGTGDISIGFNLTFDQVWKGSIQLTHYFGRSKNNFSPVGPTVYGEPLADWDFVGMTVERSF